MGICIYRPFTGNEKGQRESCRERQGLSELLLQKFDRKYDNFIEQARKENPIPKTTEKKRGWKKKGKILALVERLANYKASVCLFIHNFMVPFDNNQAERDLRMMTEVSGCFQTEDKGGNCMQRGMM